METKSDEGSESLESDLSNECDIEQILEKHSNYREYLNTLNPTSKKVHTADLSRYITFCTETDIPVFNHTSILPFLNSLREQRRKTSTIKRNLSILKAFFMYIEDVDIYKIYPLIWTKLK